MPKRTTSSDHSFAFLVSNFNRFNTSIPILDSSPSQHHLPSNNNNPTPSTQKSQDKYISEEKGPVLFISMPILSHLKSVFKPTPLFKNTGSTARDHLANERTFLAWLRTGLGFVALGVAVERFSRIDLESLLPSPSQQSADQGRQDNDGDESKSGEQQQELLVGGLLGTGTGSIVYGTVRYFDNLRLVEQGMFRPGFHGVAGLSVGVLGIVGCVSWNTLMRREDGEDRRGKSGTKRRDG